ncbi:MAG TPA: hypothetical protein VME92_05185 [Acetobacteraceae bacterium]|nr:hypothetical protein [Acetobacteraceae bacterium]
MRSPVVIAVLGTAFTIAPAWAQVTHLPAFPQPSSSDQIVGFILQNSTSTALPMEAVTFGQAFADGAVQPSDTLQAMFPGVSSPPVQMDVKTTYADGSVKFAVLTTLQPQLDPGQSVPGMLEEGPQFSNPAVDLDQLAQNETQQIVVTIYPNATPATYSPQAPASMGSGSQTYTFDVGNLFHTAIAKGTVSYWLQGPIVTEGRIDVPVAGSLHLVIDLASYNMSNAHIVEDMQLRNDDAMQPSGGPMVYDIATNFNGQQFSVSGITQYQYQVWHHVFNSAGTAGVNVQHDVLYLEKAGAIPSYSTADGVDASLIAGNAQYANPPLLLNGMLTNDGITMYMGQTGGRCDISFVSCVDAEWLMTQDPQAAANALGWADAAGAVPWHYWDPTNGHYLSVRDYPNLWADDYRAGTDGTTALTQTSPQNSGGSPLSNWSPDTAHVPSLSYVPYLLTGSRYYLDNTIAQTLGEVMETYPGIREGEGGSNGYPVSTDEGIIANLTGQVRAAAWGLRDLQDADWVAPDADPEKAYLDWLLANNYAYLSAQQQYLATVEGGPQGYLIEGATGMATWQEDYFQTEIALESYRDFASARALTTWAANYTVGRFLNSANGMSPWNGVGYYPPIQYPAGTYLTTWKMLNDEDIANPYGVSGACTETNGVCTDWSGEITGDYVQSAVATISTTSNAGIDAASARQALSWLYGNDPNSWLTQATYQTSPSWDVRTLGN